LALSETRPSDPVTGRMHQDFTQLRAGQTVGEALDWLRRNPPSGRVIYFYVVDGEGRLQGVVPTRRLVLSPTPTPLTDIMVIDPVAIPGGATVLEACEFFIQHRLLAFPVVDEAKRLLGVVDIDLYTEALNRPGRASPVSRLVAPLARFFHIEASGGLVLLACTAVALLLANSPLAAKFESFWDTPVGLTLGGFSLEMSLLHWINDGLMTLFFFVVGLEIKRELTTGELADPRKALLPVVAALGGMVVPAALYLLCLWGRPGWKGWGVPMATDIAFVVGFLTLFGERTPNGLKILLLTLAIADDIGAILVIAVVYSTDLSFTALGLAGVGFGLIPLLRWVGVQSVAVYTMVGAGIWLAFLKSGVHPTVAGVLLGLLTPARPAPGRRVLFDVVGDFYARMRGDPRGAAHETTEAVSPLDRLEAGLHPWVAFVIMPVFALANAGVTVEWAALATPVALAVIAGLCLGKPLGIVLFSWASVRIGLTRLPEGMTWKVMVGAGCLAGIGFTMSLFIAGMAFSGNLRDEAKIGILAGSMLSGVAGALLLLAFLPRNAVAGSDSPTNGLR
jgi:Na+:H+ antiporter, NhaA family